MCKLRNSALSGSRGLIAALLMSIGAGTAVPSDANAADVFRYAEDQAPAIVNPVFATSMSEARLNELVFEGLYTDNQDLATVPLLAKSSTVNVDRTEMTITLQSGVRWHDGKPFTAADVVFTIDALKNPRTLSTESGRVSWIKRAIAEDDHTLRLVFNQAEASPQDKLFFKILPKHAFDSTTLKRTDSFRTAPIGTGPYRVDRYNDDNSVSLSRVAEYRANGGIQEVVLREVSDKNYQAKLLLYESLEALVRVLPRDLAVLQNNRKVELYPYQTNSWWYLGFNQARPPFDDARVREAMGNMVDLQALLAPVGTGDLLSGPFVRSSPYYNHDVKPRTANPRQAAALLEAAGFAREGRYWARDGKPLSVRITAHKGLETSQEVVINLQSQLQNAGVEVHVDFLDEALWKANVWRDRNFDVVLSQWSFDRSEDVREQFHSEGTRNFTGYRSEVVDALLDRARDTTDPHEKKQVLRELHSVVHNDAPMIFLWTLDSYSAMTTHVRDVVIHPFYFFTWSLDWQMQ